jgi:hypothetical protein
MTLFRAPPPIPQETPRRRPTGRTKGHPEVGTELKKLNHHFEPSEVFNMGPRDPRLPGLKVRPDESPEDIRAPTREYGLWHPLYAPFTRSDKES